MREARRLIRTSEQHRLGVFRHLGEAFLGWALCQQGSLDQGIATLEQANAALAAVEFRLSEAGFLAILAEAKCRRGMVLEARSLSERALATARIADRWLEPEVLRIAALVAVALAPADSAALTLLREAVLCARRIASPVFELRCLDTLSRLADPFERSAIEGRIGELAAFRGLDRRLRQQLQAR
jgi:hypothetical protein